MGSLRGSGKPTLQRKRTLFWLLVCIASPSILNGCTKSYFSFEKSLRSLGVVKKLTNLVLPVSFITLS